MKLYISIFERYAFLLLFFLFAGCKSEQIYMQDFVLEKEIFIDINQEFIYPLGTGIPTEGGFSIKNQANHYQTSEIILNSDNGLKLQYVYIPSLGFEGNDFVILQNCISIGSSNCDKIELFKFNFHIK